MEFFDCNTASYINSVIGLISGLYTLQIGESGLIWGGDYFIPGGAAFSA